MCLLGDFCVIAFTQSYTKIIHKVSLRKEIVILNEVTKLKYNSLDFNYYESLIDCLQFDKFYDFNRVSWLSQSQFTRNNVKIIFGPYLSQFIF